MKHIIKRAGHTEPYDNKKLYASIYAACLAMREQPETAEMISEKVVKNVELWLEKKHEVLSNDIRLAAAKQLHAFNQEAAFAYLHHRIIW